MDLERITSGDGTQIAAYRSGQGPPLILVHGIGGPNPVAWTAVFRALTQQFTVYAMDRRGRRESADAESYELQREFEDVAAVVDAAGKEVNVLGHSFGGMIALEAALLTPNVGKLVLYDPQPLLGVPWDADTFIDGLEGLLDAGNREAVLTRFYCDVAGMSEARIERFKAAPDWATRVASAHTILREMRAGVRYRIDLDRFRDLHVPTLLLLGAHDPPFVREAAEAVDTALPDSRIVVLPGQGHMAIYQAPDLFLAQVLPFLTGSA